MPQTPLTPKSIRNLGIYGVIRQAEVDDSLIPDGAVVDAINFHFDRKGAATVRPGIAALSSTVLTSRPCTGIHNSQSSTMLVVFSNGGSSAIYSYSGAAWGLSLTEGTASVRIRFVDFGSYSIVLNFNHNTYSSMRFWTGTADGASYWKTTGSPINPQNMWGYSPTLGEVYKSRVYLSGDKQIAGSGQNASNPSRLFFSSVISSTGNITWSPNNDYVDINPGDGENITALKRFSLELLVFKPNYTYRFRTSGVDPDPLIRIGTRSQESVVEGKRGVYFHHDSGFYRYSGGYPEEISRPISDIVDAIPFSQYDDIISWKDSDHIYWSIGHVTVSEAYQSVTIKNCVVRYTESSDVWTVYSYPSDIRGASNFNSSSNLTRVLATDLGVVATLNSGTTDIGEPIPYRIVTKWCDFGTMATRKVLQQLASYCEKAQGSELFYQVDDSTEWESLGQQRKFVELFEPLNVAFRRIRFKLAGLSRSQAPVYLGLDVTKGLSEGIIKDA